MITRTTPLFDVNGHKTTIATVAGAASYSGAALNGADVANNIGAAAHGFGFLPSATLAANASSYVDQSTITWTGTYHGVATTRTGTIVGTDGGTTVTADGPLDTVTQIDIEAQADTNGAFEFGWVGAYPPKRPGTDRTWHIRRVVGNAAGNIVVGYGSHDDTLVSGANQAHDVTPLHVVSTTCSSVTIYYE